MSDYEAMYMALFKASAKAVEMLIQAHRDAEEIFIASGMPEMRLLRSKELNGTPDADKDE